MSNVHVGASQWTPEGSAQHYREIKRRLERVHVIDRPAIARISDQMAKAHALLDQFEEKTPCFNTLRIQKAVCSFYHVTRDELLSMRRQKKLMRPRHVAVYLTKELTRQSLKQIGMKFAGRDHTTILNSINRISKALMEDDCLRDEIAAIKVLLGVKGDASGQGEQG